MRNIWSRTLRGCANRNRVRTAYPKGRKASHLTRVRESKRTNLHTGKDAPGRTLRGHANQNNAFFFLAAAGIRRTHAGARIEITLDEISAEMAARRTSRGCANRNLVANAICVDEPPLSHPARVCESKPLDDRTKTTGVMSHAARVRESKCLIQLYRLINDPSHLMRVRESK